jgi:O-antigen/teichoic acid export membrane protein
MAGPHVVAQFVLFNRFFEIIRFAVSNFTLVLQPIIVDSEVNNPSKVKHLYITSIVRVVLLLIGVFLIFNQWGYEIFMWWSKHRYVFDKSLFQLFLLYTILILIDNVSALFLSALKLNKTPTLISLVQGCLVVLAPVLFYETYGLFGVIAASCVALLLTNFIFNPVYLWKRIQH